MRGTTRCDQCGIGFGGHTIGCPTVPKTTISMEEMGKMAKEMSINDVILTDAQRRKQHPVYSGFVKYFPKAMMEVAHLSWVGNEQHNPGTDLHWDRSKSGDELDACMRHLLEAGTIDTDGVRHSAKAAWRAMANLEKELEAAEKG